MVKKLLIFLKKGICALEFSEEKQCYEKILFEGNSTISVNDVGSFGDRLTDRYEVEDFDEEFSIDIVDLGSNRELKQELLKRCSSAKSKTEITWGDSLTIEEDGTYCLGDNHSYKIDPSVCEEINNILFDDSSKSLVVCKDTVKDNENTDNNNSKTNKKLIAIFVMTLVAAILIVAGFFAFSKDDVLDKAKVGDIVAFGKYDGKVLDWKVLKVDGNKKLMISVRGIALMPINFSNKEVTWTQTDLSRWLNDEFMESFSLLERRKILDYDWDKMSTLRLVSLLSEHEVYTYLKSDDRMCFYGDKNDSQCTDWWLRTPASWNSSKMTYVDSNGGLSRWLGSDISEYKAVRPVVWVDVDKWFDLNICCKNLFFKLTNK